ncbi:MAG: glycerol-3-phosphate 1-O-acyltransferase PlsY [Armatimonadetes bacterium]|nr:glycerol-3-phosphate 1-O-acyltransferase PlsY [Armatimonadota bacterium]
MNPLVVALAVAGFLMGSMPTGVLIAKSQGIDILSVGSKNPGASNVYRTLGPKWGVIVFLIDALKGFIPASITSWVLVKPDMGFWVGIAAILGHMFSPWLKFKGGKGVATGLGALLGSVPIAALIAFAGFLVIVAITRYISLGSLVAAVILVSEGFIFNYALPVKVGFSMLAILLFYLHRGNIKRLLNGTESKFGQKLTDGVHNG